MTCYICGSDKFIDDHHYDCCEGKLSPEKVPLCRRCHRTYHDLGVEWFDDEYLDRAIEIENKRREIYRLAPTPHHYPEGYPYPLKREDIKRSDYWNKTHGLPQEAKVKTKVLTKDSGTPPFPLHLPHGEPLCGWEWVYEHLHDLIDWVPRIEIIHPDLHLTADIESPKKLKEVVKALRGIKKERGYKGILHQSSPLPNKQEE